VDVDLVMQKKEGDGRCQRAAVNPIMQRLVVLAWFFGTTSSSNNCSLTPPAARANVCNGGGCQCWCTPAEGAYTIWQWAPSGPVDGAPDTCCYDPTATPPCFGARPLLSNTLGDHMVLQSAPRSAQIFGWADPGDEITVTLQAVDSAIPPQVHTAAAAADHSWSVQLTPVAAGAAPYNITAWSKRLSDGVTLVDILFGELWMCGGQSNMELTVSQAFNASTEVARASGYPLVRLFTVGQEYIDGQREYEQLRSIWQDWSVASPHAVGAGNWTVFSATCWFFGRELHEKLQVPVGLVSNNWGGTTIQTWMPPAAVRSCQAPPRMRTLTRPPRTQHPRLGSRPMPSGASVLWNTMVAPWTRQTFRGVVFYQGESNAVRGKNGEAEAYYSCAIRALIREWRQRFAHGQDLAFHQTLLAPINTLWGFAGIRLGQQAVFNATNPIENAGIASAIDAGDPDGPWSSTLHPRNKQALGRRLSLVARALTYGESGLTYEGPRMDSVNITSLPVGAESWSANMTIVATVHFVPSTVGEDLTLGMPVASTRRMCLAGAISSLCGYYTIVYFHNSSTTHGIQVGRVRARAALSADRRALILTASVPRGVTVSSVEALNNEWPVVTLYNSAGLPMYPFVLTAVPLPTPPPPPPPRPRFCVNNDIAPCAGGTLPVTDAVPCGGGKLCLAVVLCTLRAFEQAVECLYCIFCPQLRVYRVQARICSRAGTATNGCVPTLAD
jgi:sialate O-acetylesterase